MVNSKKIAVYKDEHSGKKVGDCPAMVLDLMYGQAINDLHRCEKN
jgi:hypothetical protein